MRGERTVRRENRRARRNHDQPASVVLTSTVPVRTVSVLWEPFSLGAYELLQAGATVRTGPTSHAVITDFDGSTVTLEPETELTLEAIEATGAGDVVISLVQQVGRSWHVIAHKLTGGSTYHVSL